MLPRRKKRIFINCPVCNAPYTFYIIEYLQYPGIVVMDCDQ